MIPLHVNNVVKTYANDVRALKGISFDLKQGEIFGLLGPNGSGKTTLISIVCSLLQASEGYVEVFGERVNNKNLNFKHLIGVVPQEIISHGFFTVEEVLNFISGYYGIVDNKKHIDYLLLNLGLQEHRQKKVSQLSGGMKRRLLIAKALVHQPKLLLLDEPTAGVDIELRNSLWDFVKKLNHNGCTILLTTHYLEEAESLCQRVGIIDHGRLLRLGGTKEIIKDFTNREFVLKINKKDIKINSPYLVESKGGTHIFRVPAQMDFSSLIHHLSLDIDSIQDFHIRDGNLEDAFLRVLGDAKNES